MILSNSCVLNERYSIQSVLGEVGPFDVNYLAWDLNNEKEVVVREYYPVRLAKRAADGITLEVNDADLFEYGLGAYSAEGMLLAKVSHPNVAGSQEQFKQNGTVYCVNNFVSGASLSAFLKQQNGKMDEEEALLLIEKVLDALSICHEHKLYHGGISPKSVLVDSNGEPVVLGFQAARFKLARECDNLQDILRPGYSAPEQTTCEIEEGPWWDIYGSAATLFHILTGRDLPAAKDKWSANKIRVALYHDAVIKAEMCDILALALALEPSERPVSIVDFSNMLLQTQKKLPQHLHEGDGLSQFQIGYEPEVSHKEGVWQNGVDIASAKIKIETEVPPVTTPFVDENDLVDRDMPNVIPGNPPQLLQTSTPDTPPRLETKTSDSSGREKELEVLLTKMVKWQQVFVAFILGIVVIALLGLVGGMFIGTDFFQQDGASVAQSAGNAAVPSEAGPNSAAAAALATAAVAPQEDDLIDKEENERAEMVEASESAGIQIDDAGEPLSDAELKVEESIAENPVSEKPAAEKPVVNKTPERREPEPQKTPERTLPAPAITKTSASENESKKEDAQTRAAPFFTDEELGVSVEEEADATPEGDVANPAERESLFNYYRVQGDSLMNQGFETAALQWYRNALKYKASDTYINEQINAITNSINTQAEALKTQDSLQMRLEQVRDQTGIFLLPDTPIVIDDEPGLRSKIKYPIAAINGGISGRVILRYVVDERGQIQDVNVVKGLGWGTEDVVIKLLRQATFQPATFNGEPVKAWGTFTTVFRLKN